MNITLSLEDRDVTLLVELLKMHGLYGTVNPVPSTLPLPDGFDHYDVENLLASIEAQSDFPAPADDEDEHDQFRSDVEADADVLASAGMGTDEDYWVDSYAEGEERDFDERF